MTLDAQSAALLHMLFEYAGIATGVALYRAARRDAALPGVTAPGTFAIVCGLLIGAAIGNKLVFFIERPDVAAALWGGSAVWPGQSIVGGLLGGLIGVEIAKALTRQSRSTGDMMVVPIAVGLAIGRIGCFVAGLHDDTYGVPSALPWAIDFGDGVPRHPTQLYEIAVVLMLAAILASARQSLSSVPGLAFKLFLIAYLAWRIVADALKPVPFAYPGHLSGIQWTCIAALLLYAPFVARALAAWRRNTRMATA